MIKKLFITVFYCCSLSICTYAQVEETKSFGIKFTGFIKNDFFFDTRQTVAVREGNFLLYPADKFQDEEGNDINARSNFNFLSIQSRLAGNVTGPDAFGAKTTGLLEGAFCGQSDTDINGFRLRHAMVKLNWTNTELLIGQYWHMMFITGCFPATISFNTGAPFQFFSRNPQIRLTHKIGKLSMAGMVASQRDFSNPGGCTSMRNSKLPDLQAQITYTEGNVFAGITAGYKQLFPRLYTDSLYKATSSIGGFNGQAFLKITTTPVTLKLQTTYLQNGYDGLAIGGYAIEKITDPSKDYREYTSINNINFWADLHTNNKIVQLGLFTGYTQNLGSAETLEDVSKISLYSRGWNIASLYRVSPRIMVNSGKTSFAFEFEHTGAAYGSHVNNEGIPQDLHMVVNNRFLLGAYYFF